MADVDDHDLNEFLEGQMGLAGRYNDAVRPRVSIPDSPAVGPVHAVLPPLETRTAARVRLQLIHWSVSLALLALLLYVLISYHIIH